MSVYKNTKRHTGTQRESPSITCEPTQCKIGGYQRFILTKTRVIPHSYKKKFEYIHKILIKQKQSCETIADLGSSTGLVCFAASLLDYQSYALDHDLDCLRVIRTAKEHFGINTVHEKEYSFGDPMNKVDILIACALIHWVFSCTALYGEFDKIINYLQEHTQKLLMIEWVDPRDPAINHFHHITFNQRVIKEKYNKTNFLKSLNKYFKTVEKGFTVCPTREIYLCWI